ncbi:MAG: hypothetical protein ABJA34_07915 [Pseudonocardiales bacterium]
MSDPALARQYGKTLSGGNGYSGADLERALEEVKPSTGAWFETARNVAQFANEGGA